MRNFFGRLYYEKFFTKGGSMNDKFKHLTLDDRIFIQQSLFCGMCFKDIAKRLGKDQTTISKEIKKHISFQGNQKLDEKGQACTCPKLLKAPFVCNACQKKNYNCGFQKQLYYAKQADSIYKETLKSSRECIALNKETFYLDDSILSPAVTNGQHLYQIVQTNDLHSSLSTIYRHFHKGYYSASVVDLPRVVKFKARDKKKEDYVPKKIKEGRKYQDFLEYIDVNQKKSWVEMDTVIGEPGGKVLLTLDFTLCNFMVGILLNNKTSNEVSRAISELKKRFKEHGKNFGDIFDVILTDNGGEFSNVFVIEQNLNGDIETKVFYCDPYKSCQKPHVENTHTQLRNILPKGTSFDDLTQDKVDKIFSHINSTRKKSLMGKSAYEMFTFMYGEDIAKLLGIEKIPDEEVKQSKKLIKQI